MTGGTETRPQAVGGLAHAVANGMQLLARDPVAAAEQAREIIRVSSSLPDGYWLLSRALRLLGRADEAIGAERQGVATASQLPSLREATMAIAQGRLERAEHLIRPYLVDHADDPVALRLLARIAAGTGHLDDARALLAKALEIAPSYEEAQREQEALASSIAFAPDTAEGRSTAPPEGSAEFEEAIRLNEQAITLHPERPDLWVSYGHVLRISGRQDDSISAYRKAVSLSPACGDAWWSLADLKTTRFDEDDVARMREALDEPALDEQARINIHFALGKALADLGRHEDSFRHYAEGNRGKQAQTPFHAESVSRHVAACCETFTQDFFASRQGLGSTAADPIFVLGMPRSGSTLVEQILASHPSVEGTEELQDIAKLARVLADGKSAGLEDSPYVDAVAALTPSRIQMLAEAYLWGAGRQRKSSRPFFIDKMPNNWLHVGLIHLILPNAKIVDMRRHPLACGLSNFRQNFARGQGFSYDLGDIGHFYADYVRLMAHFDAVLPGRIHRVIYEELVAEPEAEVRRLLDYAGLPFDPACLKFHENSRAVKTSSSEQVRRPLNRDGIDQWKPYEPWLKPLEEALGPVLTAYPEPPPEWQR